MRSRFVLIVPLVTAFAIIGGCYKEWTFDGNLGDCRDPKDLHYNTSWCLEARCAVDAGYEGCDGGTSESSSSSSSSSGSSARCSGTCVENAPNDFSSPQIVYVGKPLAKYSYSCPTEAGAFGGREYFDLQVPDPGCPKCVCGAIEGTCNPRPSSITIRAGSCDVLQPATVDFSPPENWDGSCSNLNGLSAGVECPPGSGAPCAQSVYASTLLEPVQGCEPIPLPVPKATSGYPRWKTMVLSCSTTPRFEACTEAAASTCLPPLPTDEIGWRYCVRHDDPGVHSCPSSLDSPFSEQVIAYSDYVDTRKCTECDCKALGGSCHGILRVYKDNACSTNEMLTMEGISSEFALCSNFSMAGTEVGSKEMTDIVYVPGSCEPTGGVPVGTAYPDDSTAATWCCMAEVPKKGSSAG